MAITVREIQRQIETKKEPHRELHIYIEREAGRVKEKVKKGKEEGEKKREENLGDCDTCCFCLLSIHIPSSVFSFYLVIWETSALYSHPVHVPYVGRTSRSLTPGMSTQVRLSNQHGLLFDHNDGHM